MIIHIVQSGETINTIAERYNLSAEIIIKDNGLLVPNNLVPGQTIVIVYPEQTHIVQEGDTLVDISRLYDVSTRQLLRNNPYLFDQEYLMPGEILTISYGEKKGKVAVNGFAYVFINRDVLRKTLPYLTYLTILNYQFTEDYQIFGEDDSEIIQMCIEAGVIPLLQITTFVTQSTETIEATLRILYSEEIQELIINNIIVILKSSGYYGINVTFTYIDSENYELYNNYLARLTSRLHNEGLLVFVTLAPRARLNVVEITIDKVDYTEIGMLADGINLLQFDWSVSLETPSIQTTTYIGRELVDHARTLIPTDKIYTGYSIIAYDWPLPYEIGVTRANSLTIYSAIDIARGAGVPILYDDLAESAFFNYVENRRGVPIQHLVWFKDARSIDTRANSVLENGFAGLSIWNTMYFYTQMWFVINSQYEIETLLVVDQEEQL